MSKTSPSTYSPFTKPPNRNRLNIYLCHPVFSLVYSIVSGGFSRCNAASSSFFQRIPYSFLRAGHPFLQELSPYTQQTTYTYIYSGMRQKDMVGEEFCGIAEETNLVQILYRNVYLRSSCIFKDDKNISDVGAAFVYRCFFPQRPS